MFCSEKQLYPLHPVQRFMFVDIYLWWKKKLGAWFCFSVHFTADELPDRLRQHGVLWSPRENRAGRGGAGNSSEWSRISAVIGSLLSRITSAFSHSHSPLNSILYFVQTHFILQCICFTFFLCPCLLIFNFNIGNKCHRYFHWLRFGVSMWYSHISGTPFNQVTPAVSQWCCSSFVFPVSVFSLHINMLLYFPVFFFSPFSSQTYGSGNLKHVGVILQQGVLILLLACFPCWAILINTQPILLAVRQSAEVARWTLSTSSSGHHSQTITLDETDFFNKYTYS